MSSSGRQRADVEVAPEEFSPAWAVHPGVLIQRELDAANLSQTAVAARSGISAKHINQLIRGHVILSAEVAVALERVLGSPADLWLRMDATWQAAQARDAASDRRKGWTYWLEHFPADALVGRGVWAKDQSAADRVGSLLAFFGVVSPDAFADVWLDPQANFRRSQKFDVDAYGTAVWLRLVEASAERQAVAAPLFDVARLRQIAKQLPWLTTLPAVEGLREARRLLRQAGVLLIVEPEIDGTRICGVSRRSATDRPVIALTGRQRKLDILWFTLLHEIGHVLLHPKRSTYLDLDRPKAARVDDDKDEQEGAADAYAADVLVPATARARVLKMRSTPDLLALAAELGVGPGTLAGRYGHETGDWKTFGRYRVSVSNDDLSAIMKD